MATPHISAATPRSGLATSRHGQPRRQRWTVNRFVNRIWGLFSSVKFAVVLIGLIAAVCIIGVFFTQAPIEIRSSPTDYAAWLNTNVRPTYGSWTDLLNWLQFFTIFASWYFRLLLTLLAISICICTANRAPGIWHNFRHPLIRRSDRFYQNARERAEFMTDHNIDEVRRAFRRRRYRVRDVTDEETGVIYLYANKNSWATLSTFVFHACLVIILLSGVITAWRGFGDHSMAQRILPAPIYNYFQSLAGFSYPQPLPNGENGIVYPIGTPHNLEYHVNQFVATFNPQTGQPTDFYTDLVVYQDGREVAAHRVRVNSPLTYQGVTFHQASFSMYAWVEIRDAHGNVLYNEKQSLDERDNFGLGGNAPPLPLNIARDLPFAAGNGTLTIAAVDLPQQGGWLVVVEGFNQAGAAQYRGLAFAGHTTRMSNGWTLTVKEVKPETVLLITKDSGAPLLFPTAFLLVLSLCVTFYFPQRRIWARIADRHVQLGILKEHFVNMRTELESITTELAAREQGAISALPTPPARAGV